ncbi:MAG: rhomboid family intramembrane serine protease [Acidimicrobiia bacterium]|nr:rhomboid family intramembrane serine protease [Acidimicrobiia bacterium]
MAGERYRAPKLARGLSTPIGLILAVLVLLWAIEAADSALLGERLQAHGIGPRRIDGLEGIVLAPLLHGGFGHLLSNSVPFVALGWLVALRGIRYWLWVTVIAVVLGGGLTWLLAGGTNHIGASGVVFAYLGALLGGAFYDRRAQVLAPALIAVLLYGGLLAGAVPQADVSWEGHLYGLVAGVLVARQLAEPPAEADPEADGPQYPWEADEPWLDDE